MSPPSDAPEQERPFKFSPSRTPYDFIVEEAKIPIEKKALLPRRWEKIGDVLLLKIPEGLLPHRAEVAAAYARVLGAKAVLRDLGIVGTLREPEVELMYGTDTETVHTENDVRFALDPARVMFSSGNVDERIRMSGVPEDGEVVADMFAGIGYFSVPIAVHSSPAKVLASELNPVSYRYLERNIELNGVGDVIRPIAGDCREVMPEGTADRVIMGYVGSTHEFLDKAMRIVKHEGGMLHYHETCPNDILPDRPSRRVVKAANANGRSAEVVNLRTVKSYAPGVSHIVLDAMIK
jgi:tRNA wybutosine-synthesizing protein 2